MADIIAALEEMFERKGRGEVEMPPKPGIHPGGDAFIHAMPAYIPSSGAAGVKWVSGFPQNQGRGLPTIHGLLILNDPATGVPICVMDATWITAERTGAATAVAAKYLARSDSTSVGIVACGVQGRSNLKALWCTFDITKVVCFDIRSEAAAGFAEEIGEELDIAVSVVDDPRQAVAGLDLVVTSGPILKEPSPVIDADWLAPGAFACPVDFDSYWQPAALAQADLIASDDHDQLSYYRSQGYFGQTPEAYADLGEIVCGDKPGRTDDEQRTIALNLGLALEDMATAILIYQRAQQQSLGRRLPL